jgi:hypothetical protein
MQSGGRSAGILLGLSGLLLGAFAWNLTLHNQEQTQMYQRLAWSLRHGDQEARLTSAQSAYLRGSYVEALRQLGKPDTSAERELQSALFLCTLYDLEWPQQVLMVQQLESSPSGRPRLLARVVQSGYAKEANRVRLDLLGWDGKNLETLKPLLKIPGRDASKSLSKDDDWSTIDELTVVHLDRKDAQQSQLWVEGKTVGGRARLEVIYGFSQWRRWGLLSEKPARRLADRVSLGSDAYKLVDDEWIEVR